MIDEREIALATEHPRGTEKRRLGPYREALNDRHAYARLPEKDRDAIVRWVETRRLVKERTGLDHDPANLADPLLPLDRLRRHVLEGESIAADVPTVPDEDGDLMIAVAAIRRNAQGM